MTLRTQFIRILLLGMAFAVASQGVAATVTRQLTGNDCAGYFGTGFDDCVIFVIEGEQRIDFSPVIAKFDADLNLDESNDVRYPSIDGSEFQFSATGSENSTGTWSYLAGTDDPAIRFWTAKAGDVFNLFWEVEDSALQDGGVCDVPDPYVAACVNAAVALTSGNWATPDDKELSHISFYDSAFNAIVPVPPALWLFGSALGSLVWIRRSAA